ncbi:MAG: methionine synthase [Bacteroidales bacterium]|nr:methionine synthase [Bacteroidales bacterium]
MRDIRQELGRKILILDGAMGTMLQAHGLSGNSEAFNFSEPDIIRSIHSEYIAAGADIIETNTFSANRISQAEYGMADKAGEMAFEGARIARLAADAAPRKVWVAGSIGPTGKSLSLAQDLSDPSFRPYSFDDMAAAYEEQIRNLIRGGVDLLVFETCFDALNTKAGLYALSRIPEGKDIPVMISASVSDRSGRMLTGQTIEAFYRSVQHAPLLSFGLNCSLGADDLAPLVKEAASWASCAISCYPNAGLPNSMGGYDETPEHMAAEVEKIAREGILNIVGGCCGTTPAHIRAIVDAVRSLSPRSIPEKEKRLDVSGLESVTIDTRVSNFTNIGERTNVAGSRKFARLIAAGDYDTALQVAAGQIENGASVIDINMDDAMLDSTVEMQRFLRHISNDPAVARAAIMVDSSHWETIVAGLKNAQGKCIVNSISLKEGEEPFLAKAREIKALGAAVVVMAFDEEGQATTYERKIQICQRAYRLLVDTAGFEPTDIIFDVNVLSIGTGIAEHALYGVDFIEAVRWIRHNLPGALTSGGISNLSFAFRGNNAVREAMHSVFLYHAIAAGLDMGIVNPAMLKVYDDIEPEMLRCVEDVVLNRDPEATERLIDKAQRVLAEGSAPAESQSDAVPAETLPVRERLIQALVKGNPSTLGDDIMECLAETGRPVDVIEGPLMAGMARVGELFGAGKMFLPQVVKSAKIMRDAVGILQPYIEADAEGSGSARPKIVIATVKGDVHDIGKNITAIVLGCNGFEVTDLGVMVPKETILDKAAEIGADLICASGLITPSLYQMEELCREMKNRGMDTPLLIGGATTSALHTAVKLSPLYDHVFYGSDASSSAVLAKRLISSREETEREQHAGQEKLRNIYENAGTAVDKPAETSSFPEDHFLRGRFFDDIPARELSVSEVLPYFDWNLFYAIWGIKPGAAKEDETMLNLNRDAIAMIDRIIATGGVRIVISARFDACHSVGDDIVCDAYRIPMLRQENSEGRSLSDFTAPASYGFDSPAGMFAISVHRSHPFRRCTCETCATEFEPMLERSVRLTLAEAASGWLDAQLEKKMKDEGVSGMKLVKPAAGYASCPDHTLKRDILSLLPGAEELDIRLTDSCAMIPDASICGFVFAHKDASFPDIRRISDEARSAYAAKRGMSGDDVRKFLGTLC